MSFDEGLAERIRDALDERSDVSEKKMFGGLAFLLRGNMCVGVVRGELMVRVGPDAYAEAVREPHARPMDFTGRSMKGFVYVGSEGIESDADLLRWVARGVDFACSLPPK
jgi:TfoX/Sxy family transcriptional regulator of competence genes